MDINSLRKAQPEVIRIIDNSIKTNRLSHAYIFEGEAGTRKFDAALYFAASLLCKENQAPCGTCNNCRRIEHLTHPNIYYIKPSKRQIVKEDIRLLQDEFSKTALEEGAKIYIIDQAETMNQYASNSLLKFLEEPHADIYALLLTTDQSKLLTTIRSRSQHIHFHALPSHAIYEGLIKEGYEDQLARLASVKSYSMVEAETFLSTENLYDMIDIVYAIYEAFTRKDSLVLTFNQEIQTIIKSTEDFLTLLDVMIYYQKDLIYGKMNHYKKIIFKDQLATIETIIHYKSKAMLLEELDHMLDLKNRLSNYINERLAFDNLMLALERRQESGE
ncbi:MAG: DNA polymerase III subunit delta' [Candidatus Izemoplasmataceae bacterium]